MRSCIYSKSLDLICITETWLHDSILNTEIFSHNYTIYWRDRGSRGGGIVIAISDNLTSKIVLFHRSLESIAVEIDISPKTLIVCMYVPPSCPEAYQLEAIYYLNSLPTDHEIIVLRDFNAPDIDWPTLTGTTNYSLSLCNAAYNKNLTQIINVPTHKQGNTLDLILTNSPSRIVNLNIQTSPSDHHMITLDLLTHTSQHSKYNLKSSKLLYSRGDYESMNDFLYLATNTSEFKQIMGTDAAWNELKNTITSACKRFVPKITIPRKTYPE